MPPARPASASRLRLRRAYTVAARFPGAEPFPGITWTAITPCVGIRVLFANAELAEYHAEQVVGGEFAGDLSQRLMRQAQFLRKEFQLTS